MRRFALAVIVCLLSFSVSAVNAVWTEEPCTFEEPQQTTDRDCPPMCVTCGCCAQAAEPSVLVQVDVVTLPVRGTKPPTYRLIDAEPRDIFHVPRTSVL